jgi:hypothetical protein
LNLRHFCIAGTIYVRWLHKLYHIWHDRMSIEYRIKEIFLNCITKLAIGVLRAVDCDTFNKMAIKSDQWHLRVYTTFVWCFYWKSHSVWHSWIFQKGTVSFFINYQCFTTFAKFLNAISCSRSNVMLQEKENKSGNTAFNLIN